MHYIALYFIKVIVFIFYFENSVIFYFGNFIVITLILCLYSFRQFVYLASQCYTTARGLNVLTRIGNSHLQVLHVHTCTCSGCQEGDGFPLFNQSVDDSALSLSLNKGLYYRA